MGTQEPETEERQEGPFASEVGGEDGGAGGAPEASEETQEARAHDFTRSEALSAATVQALEGVYASFARAAAAELSSYLHTPFEISLASLDQLTYDEFMRSAPDPTVVGVFRVEALSGRGMLELSPAICLWIVDHLLGGEGEVVEAPRPLTEMEQALIEGTLSRLLDELSTAWQELVPLKPELVEIADSARAVDVGRRAEAVAAASFEVSVGPVKERAQICLPAIWLKLGRAESRGDVREEGESGKEDASSLRSRLARVLGCVPVTCVVRLGTAAISAGALATLQEGDVVCLDRRANEELEMLIGETRKFRCRPIASEDRVAVEILGDAS